MNPEIKERIAQYCMFDDPSRCYLMVMLARKKENPDLTERHKLERCNRYVVQNQEGVDHALEDMERKSKLFPELVFRVYVSVSRRCLKKGMYELSTRLAHMSMDLINGNVQAYTTASRMGSEYKSLLAEKCCRAERRLLFDVDYNNKVEQDWNGFNDFVNKLRALTKVYAAWPTLNGFAIVTDPFNVTSLGTLPGQITRKSDDYLYLGVFNYGYP